MTDIKKNICAVDYLPSKKDAENQTIENFAYFDEGESLTIKIFGDTPDYNDPKIDDLWEEFFNSNPQDVYDYCLSKGINVLDTSGNPVSSWLDIAVMLKSIDKGYVSLEHI